MPSLPIQLYTSQGRAAGDFQGALSGQVDTQRATLSVQDALGQMARDYEVRQQEMKQQSQRLLENEDRITVTNAQGRVRELVQQRMTQLQNSDDGLAGARTAVMKDFEGWTANELKTASQRAKPAMELAFARMRSEVNEQAYDAEIKFRAGKIVTDFNAGVDDDQRRVYANPAAFPDALLRQQVLARSLDLSAQTKENLTRGAGAQLAASAAASMAENSPQQFLDRLGGGNPAKAEEAAKNDPLISHLSPEALDHVTKLAHTQLQRVATESRVGIASKTQDVQAMVLNGTAVPDG